VFLAHHGGGGGVVAGEQLAVLAGAAAGAVSPGGFGVGAVAGAAGRRAGEGFDVGPVDGQRRAGAGELFGNGCLEQVVADALQPGGGQPVGVVPGQRVCGEAEGPLGLAVGEQVRAVLPVRDHAGPALVIFGQGDQGLVDAGEVGGPVAGQHGQHAGQQGADRQLPGAHAGRQQQLDRRRDAGAAGDLLQDGQRDHDGRAAPGSRTASVSAAGSRLAIRSPSRWEQVIPAACMNVASPSRSATSASQVARSREVSSRGSPSPPASDRISGVVMLRRPGPVPPQTSPSRRTPPRPAAGRGSGPAPAPPAAGRR